MYSQIVGIYKITSPSGKVYIGQSWSIKSRWNEHKFRSKSDNYGCILLSRSFKKYGFENHKLEIIHELPIDVDQKVLDEYEILYIDLYRCIGIELLNIKEGGRGGKLPKESRNKISETLKGNIPWNKGKNGIYSDDTKKKMREKKIGRILSEDHKKKIRNNSRPQNSKLIIQYSLDGEFIKEWKSIASASTELSIQEQNIGKVCMDKRKSAGGFIWKYKQQ